MFEPYHFFLNMSKVFVTSDIWFNRPNGELSHLSTNEYNDIIIENWNSVVGKKDIVYILGGLGIGDMYHLLVKLNGEIHILNNFYTEDMKFFKQLIVDAVKQSADKLLKEKIIFEKYQIKDIPKLDVFISYFPLQSWPGYETGISCFHGLTDNSDFSTNRLTCKMSNWEYKPVCIKEVLDNLKKFKKNI